MLLLTGALAFGLVVAGCSKKKADSTTHSASEPATSAVAPVAPGAVPAPVRVEREANFQLQDLQLQVEAYEKIYKRKPASLEQMVRDGFLNSLPPAPPGKRFAYDPTSARVSLVPR